MRNVLEICKQEIYIIFTFLNVICYCTFILLYLECNTEESKIYETIYTEKTQTEYKETDTIVAKKINYKDEYLAGYEIEQESYIHGIIIGRYYYLNNILFEFGNNGVYNGFFDNQNKNVSGYKYEIVSLGDNFYVNIYNKEETAAVQYRIYLKSEKLILCYEPNELQLQLKKEE